MQETKSQELASAAMPTAADRELIMRGILEVLELDDHVHKALVAEGHTTPRKYTRLETQL